MKWEAPSTGSTNVNWTDVLNAVANRPGKWLLAKEFTSNDGRSTYPIARAHSTLSYVRRRYADELTSHAVEMLVARTQRGEIGVFARKLKS